jgi:hypothetical protein
MLAASLCVDHDSRERREEKQKVLGDQVLKISCSRKLT